MSWILWAILLSCGCIYIVFLVSCLWLAREADEKIDQLGPSINITHESLKENIFLSTNTRHHTAKIACSNPASPAS
jgi:hypothetical protein